ncbi:ROK family protein [Paenibacillus sp. B01]|uniref:ROK family protein n=1 Tax=Paenibacillus sp. B01 TaxID=2660554 RepID=UPI00129B64B2|nr:ROK family protein [Paenibacillus sp. B01]QGG55647.1 ROK family protein [Paenibacillus sp. B01]
MKNSSDRRTDPPKKRIHALVSSMGTASKAELLPASGMTGSSLTRLLDEMVAEKLLSASRLGPSSGGRKPILYEINPESGYFFGLEISRRTSSLGFFDARMNAKALLHWRMDEAMTPEQLVDFAARNIRSILSDHRIEPSQVRGIGIGAVGPLDRKRGLLIAPLHFPAPGWKDVPICRLLEERTGIPARLENGANAALLGERWAMRGDNPQHLLHVHAGIGIRTAMMSGGSLVHGSVDMEGAAGQMIIQMDGPRLHSDGNYGAWEAFASVQAIERKAQADAKAGRRDVPGAAAVPPERITYDMVLQGLHDGSPYAREIFLQAAVHLGIGLANLINVLHPETVLLGGALIRSSDHVYRTAIETARRNIYYSPHYSPVFSKGVLQEDAVVFGAALTVWQEEP